jgi:crotonobetainyl-CoA:carnitine CoA-transferase CaiB-like acyl-CoA transferase
MPIGVVNSLEDLTHDPHLESVGFWQFRDHPTEGKLRFARSPIEMAESPPGLRRMPPTLGQHTREVFEEFGVVAAPEGRAVGAAQAASLARSLRR